MKRIQAKGVQCMPRWRPFRRYIDAFRKGTRRANASTERKENLKAEQKIGAIVEKLGVEKLIASLVRQHNLGQNPEAPMFLRLSLRKMVLENKKLGSEKGNGRIIAGRACYLQTIILKNISGGIPLKEGRAVYKSIATIMGIAGPLLKETFRYHPFDFKTAQRNAEKILAEITREKNQRVLVNRPRLVEAIEIGNYALSELAKDLPEKTQIAFNALEEIVERTFQVAKE